MDAIGMLKMLSIQMDLEHAEEARSSSNSSAQRDAKPACFTPKEEKAAFVHPAQLPNGKQIM